MTTGRLQIVVGKGGVGKSTVAAALALGAARHRARVLAIELEERGGLCRLLEVRPERAGEIARGAKEVSVAWFEGESALAEYLDRVIHLGPMLEPVVTHPVYRAVVAAAPGLSELLTIGKVRDEAFLQKRWDQVILDAGATGHALELLRMPSVAAATFRSGRVHREAEKIRAFLKNPERTRVHVVATPEPMAIGEASDLIGVLRDELGMSVRSVIVNRCRRAAPARIEAALDQLARSPANDPERELRRDLVRYMRSELDGERRQKRAIERLERRSGMTAVRLPRLVEPGFGRAELDLLSRKLEGLC